MPFFKRIMLLTVLFLPIACGGNNTTLYSGVQSLNVRDKPDLSAEVVAQLDQGEAVTFTGDVSENKETVNLRGREYDTNFLEIRTEDETKGWVFAATVSPIEGFELPYVHAVSGEGATLYSMVDSLRVRKYPDPGMDAFASLDEGEAVTFLGYVSVTNATYALRGVSYTSNFLLIRTAKGKEGWVFASTVNRTKMSLPDYSEDLMNEGVPLYNTLNDTYQPDTVTYLTNSLFIREGEVIRALSFTADYENGIEYIYNGIANTWQEDSAIVLNPGLAIQEIFIALIEEGLIDKNILFDGTYIDDEANIWVNIVQDEEMEPISIGVFEENLDSMLVFELTITNIDNGFLIYRKVHHV